MTRSTIRSTVGRTLLPATVLQGVALVWSDAEGIRAKLVLRNLPQSRDAPLGQGFLSSVGYHLWMAAAAIALFAAVTRQILSRLPIASSSTAGVAFRSGFLWTTCNRCMTAISARRFCTYLSLFHRAAAVQIPRTAPTLRWGQIPVGGDLARGLRAHRCPAGGVSVPLRDGSGAGGRVQISRYCGLAGFLVPLRQCNQPADVP